MFSYTKCNFVGLYSQKMLYKLFLFGHRNLMKNTIQNSGDKHF